MEAFGRVLLAVLCSSSLAVHVLGRPQSSSASSQNPIAEVLAIENSSLQGSNRNLGILPYRTLEVPWRRSLRGKGGGGGGRRGGGGGGGGGSDGLSTTGYIIGFVLSLTFLLLFAAVCWWCEKKQNNPNWKLTDCCKRNKLQLPR